uniref:Uncharacterized protein n=1 Tax=Cacopsylla melanoneura TaxID=428564 RepID=A0A8D8Y2L4_9HEMI
MGTSVLHSTLSLFLQYRSRTPPVVCDGRILFSPNKSQGFRVDRLSLLAVHLPADQILSHRVHKFGPRPLFRPFFRVLCPVHPVYDVYIAEYDRYVVGANTKVTLWTRNLRVSSDEQNGSDRVI